MKRKNHYLIPTILLSILALFLPVASAAQGGEIAFSFADIEKEVREMVEEGNIPGLSLVAIKGEKEIYMKSFGYSDVEKKTPVTADTLFQLGSCSKAFTALAALQLEEEGKLNPDDPVSRYLPWFSVSYEGETFTPTLRQFLNHTSGIPWQTLFKIPVGDTADSLEKTVRGLVGTQLNHKPGEKYEYATVNYDVIGLVIEKVSGKTFVEYLTGRVIKPLGLDNTSVGAGKKQPGMATGYKIGYYAARRYEPPVFRGNDPAGYVISNGNDMARWLKLQLGLIDTPLEPLIQKTHIPDHSAPPDVNNLSAYTLGWNISLRGDGEISHPGNNPTFTSYIAFNPGEKLAVAVLANSNSNYTRLIGNYVIKSMAGKKDIDTYLPPDNIDKTSTMVSVICLVFLVIMVVYVFFTVIGIFRGKRRFAGLNLKKIVYILLALVAAAPFVYGIVLIPEALVGATWASVSVWAPISLAASSVLVLLAMAAAYLAAFLTLLFPSRSKLKNGIPFIVVLSSLAGIANGAVLLLVFSSFSGGFAVKYLLYYLGLCLLLNAVSAKVAQTKLIKITNDVVFDLRMSLIDRIFSSIYQRFEKLDAGRIYATLNDDTYMLAGSPGVFVGILSNFTVVFFVFIYLATMSIKATIFTLGFIVAVFSLYWVVSKKATVLFEQARDTQNVFMRLIDGLVKGYKELSMHRNIKYYYRMEMENICHKYRQKRVVSLLKYLNVNVFTNALFYILMAAIAIGFRVVLPNIRVYTVITFVVALIYAIGPITRVFASIPSIVQYRVAWGRIRGFLKEIPPLGKNKELKLLPPGTNTVKSLKTVDLTYEYQAKEEFEKFKLGPINFEAKKGEIVFIIGGNGSGKTTLAKLLTGLYLPDSGSIYVNDEIPDNNRLSECYSAVFSDFHLFERLYNVQLDNREQEIRQNLEKLGIDNKVKIVDDSFSTVDLSTGQRKRLALFKVYLENNPIYLFDEIAAGQDPDFREYFYNDLLLKMKAEGKIILVITHDDHYFNVADKILKLDMGKVDYFENTDKLKTKKEIFRSIGAIANT
jgi:cyclic peptide transporter